MGKDPRTNEQLSLLAQRLTIGKAKYTYLEERREKNNN
jgi:hypothetical protein